VPVDTAQHGAPEILRASGPHEHTVEAPVHSHVLVTEELHRHGDRPAGDTQPRLSPRLPPTAVPLHVRPRAGASRPGRSERSHGTVLTRSAPRLRAGEVLEDLFGRCGGGAASVSFGGCAFQWGRSKVTFARSCLTSGRGSGKQGKGDRRGDRQRSLCG